MKKKRYKMTTQNILMRLWVHPGGTLSDVWLKIAFMKDDKLLKRFSIVLVAWKNLLGQRVFVPILHPKLPTY
jgi:hypothetical protein